MSLPMSTTSMVMASISLRGFEGLAEPGGICVSRGVRDQVRDRLAVSFVDLGEQLSRTSHAPCVASGWFSTNTPRQLASPTVSPSVAAGPRLSIVVLPFANLSRRFRAGLFCGWADEDITTDLSRISGSFVISHSTAFTYKGKSIDCERSWARELGVRYLLEGSVRRLGSQVRVGAQLIDGETGTHLWAEAVRT